MQHILDAFHVGDEFVSYICENPRAHDENDKIGIIPHFNNFDPAIEVTDDEPGISKSVRFYHITNRDQHEIVVGEEWRLRVTRVKKNSLAPRTSDNRQKIHLWVELLERHERTSFVRLSFDLKSLFRSYKSGTHHVRSEDVETIVTSTLFRYRAAGVISLLIVTAPGFKEYREPRTQTYHEWCNLVMRNLGRSLDARSLSNMYMALPELPEDAQGLTSWDSIFRVQAHA